MDGRHIVGTVSRLGFNNRHVGKMLNENIGHLRCRKGDF